MAAKERHDSRGHLIAPLPSLILFASAALVVERDDALGRSRQVGDNEADTRVKLTRMPLDLGYDTAGLLPALRLIAEAGVVAAHLVRRSPDWALEQVSDLVLQDPIGRQPDRITHALGFEELVDLRVGEDRIASKIAPLQSLDRRPRGWGDSEKRVVAQHRGRGRSGKPGGRPKTLSEVRDFARAYTKLAITALAEIAEHGVSEMARIAAANALLDRGWGKPPVALELRQPEPEDFAELIAAAHDNAIRVMTPILIGQPAKVTPSDRVE